MAATPVLTTDNLSSNRGNGMPADTLQLVLFYDGQGTATFSFEYLDSSGGRGWSSVTGIPKFDRQIVTKQYAMNGCTPTGNFTVSEVVADGAVDGLGFGILWRDVKSCYHVLRSNSPVLSPGANFVGAWPLGGMSNTVFAARAPQLTDGFAQETALAVLSGAKLLGNGKHNLTIY